MRFIVIILLFVVVFTAWQNGHSDKSSSQQSASIERDTGEPVRPTRSFSDNPKPLVVEMSLTATKTFPPTIYGTTNLPDETKLVVTLMADRPCAPNCGAQANAVVRNKRFMVTPESIPNTFPVGPYTIDVTSFSDPQLANVQAVMGHRGENLRGPYAATLSEHKGQGWVPPSRNPSEFEKNVGVAVHYVQKITGIRKVAPPPYWQRVEADNGASFAIDVNSIARLPGRRVATPGTYVELNSMTSSQLREIEIGTRGIESATATICIVDNSSCMPWNFRIWRFDCEGHYADVNSGSDLMVAPERSVAGQLAAIACAV